MSSPTASRPKSVPSDKAVVTPTLIRECRRFSRSHGVTDDQQAELTARFPGWEFKFGSGTVHPHAVGATERAITEQLLYERIVEKYGKDVRITDIGGNANRHAMAGRANVHSCNPVLSAADAVRRHPENYHSGAKYCNQPAHTCPLVPDVYLSVHSLYYLTPDEVLQFVGKATKQRLYAVAHAFTDLYGELHVVGGKAESVYEVKAEGEKLMVHMRVVGNHTGYSHPACLWLNETNYHSDGKTAMAWNSTPIGDSFLYEFVAAPLGLAPERSQGLSLCDSLNRKDYYGETSGMVAYGDQAELRPALQKLDLVHSRIISCGPFSMALFPKRSTVLVPKDLIVHVGNLLIGKERNEKTLQTCIHYMRSALKKFAVPEAMKSVCLTYGSAMAFVYSLKDEIYAFNNLCKPSYKRLYQRLTGALALGDLLCCSSGTSVEMNGISFTPSFSLCAPKPERASRRERGEDVAQAYNLTHVTPVIVGTFDARQAWPEGLPGVETGLPLKPMKQGAALAEKEEHDPKQDYSPQLFVNCPIFTPIQAVVPNPSKNNELRALANRALVATPIEDPESWKHVHRYARNHAKLVERETRTFDQLFMEWNDKFPAKQQVIHREAYAKVVCDGIERKHLAMNMFVKREVTLKTGDEFEDFDPRAIQGCTPELNVSYGPFIWAMSKALCKTWSLNDRICYTSGLTAEEVGAWRAEFDDDDDLTIVELDESRYDAHQGVGAHQCSGILKKAFGIKDYDLPAYVEENVYKKAGTSRHYTYKVPGTMTSGKADTSVSNSFMNGAKLDCLLHRFGLRETEYKMLVNGDDSLVVIRRSLTAQRREALRAFLVRENQKLGFTTKCKVRTEWHEVEYCSGLFWPVAGGYVLGPKIGRRLPKMGFGIRQLKDSEIKSMVSGMTKELSHVPVLSRYVAACNRFTKMIKQTGPAYVDKEAQYKNHCSTTHKANLATAVFFEQRYGISADLCEQSLDDALKRLESITDCVHYPFMHVFARDL